MPRKQLLILSIVLGLSVAPLVTHAQINFDPSENNKNHTSVKSLTFLSGSADPVSVTINIVNILLSFLGLASIIMFLYAGIIWFKSGDNDEELNKAKEIIKGAIIGIVLTLSAYGISYLTFNQLSNITLTNDEQYIQEQSQ